MWNIGFGELAVICIVLIIAVGPERLPSMMKTVGKTVRTLRQASRDLRESTGIDELLREDFDYRPPPRRPDPPVGPAVAREGDPVMDPTSSPMAPVTLHEPGAADAASSLPSDGPLTTTPSEGGPLMAATPAASPAAHGTATSAPVAESIAQAQPAEHANVGTTLPSDAPLAANQPPLAAAPPLAANHQPPLAAAAPALPREPAPHPSPDPVVEAKPRET